MHTSVVGVSLGHSALHTRQLKVLQELLPYAHMCGGSPSWPQCSTHTNTQQLRVLQELLLYVHKLKVL